MLFVEWHSVYSCYAFEATRLRVTKYRTSTIDVNRTDIGRLATSRPLGERSEPCLAAKRPTASDEVARGPAPYEIRRRTFLKVYFQFGSSSQFPHVRESKIVLNSRLYSVDSADLSQ